VRDLFADPTTASLPVHRVFPWQDIVPVRVIPKRVERLATELGNPWEIVQVRVRAVQSISISITTRGHLESGDILRVFHKGLIRLHIIVFGSSDLALGIGPWQVGLVDSTLVFHVSVRTVVNDLRVRHGQIGQIDQF